MNEKTLKIISISASALAITANMISAWVNDKQLDIKVTEKVAEALKNVK